MKESINRRISNFKHNFLKVIDKLKIEIECVHFLCAPCTYENRIE